MAELRGGDGIAGETRLVGFINRGSHGIGLAGRLGVVAPGNALQFGELTHQARLQIGFAQLGRTPRLPGIQTKLSGHVFGQSGDALGFIGIRSELLLVSDRRQTFGHGRQALL